MYNYYFIQNIEITLYMHGENLMAIKCIIMYVSFYIRFKNEHKILISSFC